jgi:tetratricopeptide (TPR) repeat protein
MESTLANNGPTLCLNMIVKNESKIITRLFDSVLSIIDCYCICDTGSTDNTVEIIENYFKDNGVSGKVVQEPFKNFCYNRNFALQSCVGMSDYVILLDADMILDVKLFDKKTLITADSFNIIQGNDSFYYQNMRIVKNNGLFKYIGVTHEYIEIPLNTTTTSFDKAIIFIRDIGDGGCKNNKFERDIKLLTDGIKEEPNNARYYFYLANSYYDLGRFNEAINMYKKRITIDGWKEEMWYSYYRIGICYMKQQKMSDALWYFMEGYNYYPERLEGLYELMNYYRVNGKNKLAFTIYNMCKEYLDKDINRDHYLFLHSDIYKSKLYYEYTIIAAYNGIKNINDEIITVINNHNNEVEINNLLSNMKFYKHILKPKTNFILDNSIIAEINNENTTFTSSSSCLIKNNDNNGYILNVRYVNYLINENGSYLNCDKHIITVNKYVELNNDFKVIKEELFDIEFDGRRYIGVEDVRIFHDKYQDKLVYIGTGFHINNNIGIVIGDYNVSSKKIVPTELKQNFNASNCEKNWVFVDYKNDNCIIYDWYPLKICKLNENNTITVSETKDMPKLFSKVRGSTCGFNYIKKIDENSNGNIKISIEETEIWFVGHIVSYENPRHYYHIISVFDSDMNLIRYSAPFKFEGEPIEYCLSIIVEDNRVLINYSTWDRTTRIGVYDKNYIDSIVKYS